MEIAAHLVYELDANGKQLRVVKFTDYTAEKVRNMYPSAAALRSKWSSAEERAKIIEALEDRGISFEELAKVAKQPDADPFDLLCHVAFNAPLRTRRERAEMLRKEKKDFFEQYGPEARDGTRRNARQVRRVRHGTVSDSGNPESAADFRARHGSADCSDFSAERKNCVRPCSRCRALLYAS